MKIHGWKIGFLDSPVAHSTALSARSRSAFAEVVLAVYLCFMDWDCPAVMSRHSPAVMSRHSPAVMSRHSCLMLAQCLCFVSNKCLVAVVAL